MKSTRNRNGFAWIEPEPPATKPALSTPLRAEPYKSPDYMRLVDAMGREIGIIKKQHAALIVGMANNQGRQPIEAHVKGISEMSKPLQRAVAEMIETAHRNQSGAIERLIVWHSDQSHGCACALCNKMVNDASAEHRAISEDAKRLDDAERFGFCIYHSRSPHMNGEDWRVSSYVAGTRHYEARTIREAIDKATLVAGGDEPGSP